jgi:hypothetical protein
VRLGDIIVATDGLIDVSHVRQVDGEATPRRHVEGLSEQMIRATHELRGQEFNGRPSWARWLEIDRHEELVGFTRPKATSDILYRKGRRVSHPRRTLTKHPVDLPKVHYAAIASGDILLRDEGWRDKVAETHGVVGIEMEGSGIGVAAATLGRHWFMVRGVADYCENIGKNDTWHPYASLAAAAYVRAMLAACHPFRVLSPLPESAATEPVAAIAQPSVGHDDAGWRQEIVRALSPVQFWDSLANRQNFLTVLRTGFPGRLPNLPQDDAVRYLAAVVDACATEPRRLRALREALETLPPTSNAHLALRVLRRLTVRDLLPAALEGRLDRPLERVASIELSALWPSMPWFQVLYGTPPTSWPAAVSTFLDLPGRVGDALADLLGFLTQAQHAWEAAGDHDTASVLATITQEVGSALNVSPPHPWPPEQPGHWHDFDTRPPGVSESTVDPSDAAVEGSGAQEGPSTGGHNMADVDKFNSSVGTAVQVAEHDAAGADTGSINRSGRGSPQKPEPPLVWGNVPPRNLYFTGRESLLQELHERLRRTDVAAVLPQAIHGMGGVGKSQLAIEYVYRHQSNFDIIWWIPAEQPQQVLSALTELAQRLDLPVGPEANTAVPAVKEALRRGAPYANWLLVFDNAEDLSTVQNSVPTGGSGKVLVTSRNADWSLTADTLEVDVFSRDESIRLLRRRDPDVSNEDAHRLADALGDLPLAIEQAAAWRAVTGMGAGEYLSLLAENGAELLDATASPGLQPSVAAGFKVSLDRLEATNAAAMRLLEVCAYFAPEPISRDLFANAALIGSTEDADEFDQTLRDPIRLGKAIRDVQRLALARVNHRSNTIELHRLVQAVVTEQVDESRRQDVQHRGHRLLAAANPRNPEDTSHWARYQSLISHVLASGAVQCRDAWVRTLVFDIVRYLYQWGDHTGCENLARSVYEAWRGNLGEDRPETLSIAKFLGFILWVNGKYREAADLDARTLEIYSQSVAPDDEGLGDAKLQVARDLRTAGRFEESVAINREVLATNLLSFGAEWPATIYAKHDLGVALRLAGRFAEARGVDSSNLDVETEVFGATHPVTLNTHNGLTIDERECGDYNSARLRQEQLYATYVADLGEYNPATVRAARNLAVARRKAGDHRGALELSRDTERRFRERYGDEYPDTVASAMNLAVDLRQNGDLDRSADLGKKTLELYRKTMGDDHPFTQSARTNLAITMRLRGEPEAAKEHNEAAVAGLQDKVGQDHPLALTAATNLASDYYALAEYQQAFELDSDTLDKSRRRLGEDHPSTLACNANLSLDLRALGRVAEADAVHRDVVTRYRRVLGDGHPAVLAASQQKRADCDVDPMPL